MYVFLSNSTYKYILKLISKFFEIRPLTIQNVNGGKKLKLGFGSNFIKLLFKILETIGAKSTTQNE